MTIKMRSPIVCLAVQYCNKHERECAPADDAIRAMCGVCRRDVWLNPGSREKFSESPDEYVIACLDCAWEMWKSTTSHLPDMSVKVSGVTSFIEVTCNVDPDENEELPGWVGQGIGLEVEVIGVKTEDLPAEVREAIKKRMKKEG
jgi:hypothetical protein